MSTEATPLTAEEEAELLRSLVSAPVNSAVSDLTVRRVLATLTRERAEHAALREKAQAVVDDWDESLRLWLAAGEEEGDDGPAMTALRDPERAERHERNGAALRAALDGVKG